ncbi:uncharacterized protein V1516DRAFT_670425 [Lipomyces oligophaga]|uniref:uncharacterized protein n=1 Tax=Lipomyces oligophaga TaxID=45792 RepID=UPI0034CDC2D1
MHSDNSTPVSHDRSGGPGPPDTTPRDSTPHSNHHHHHHHRHRRNHRGHIHSNGSPNLDSSIFSLDPTQEYDSSIYGPPVELTFRFHDERTSPDSVIIDENLLPGAKEGDICEVIGKTGEVLDLFELKVPSIELKRKLHPLQLSVLSGSRVANYRGSRTVTVRTVARSHVEADLLTFYIKDTYLTRGDMWRIPTTLTSRCISQGQPVDYLKSFRLTVNSIHRSGRQVKLALVGPETRAVFRSQSVRYLIFLQMSCEMWYFDETGESYFHKVINSYLPELFRHWREADAHHLITIVMFTSIDLANNPTTLKHGTRSRNVRDHYRIVVDRRKLSDWIDIMTTLRKEFASFQERVLVRTLDSTQPPDISGTISPAVKGNILEAINLAATQASQDLVTDDSQRGNLQTIVVSPGSGLFDVEENLLQRTTQTLMSSGLSIDLVCLTRMPLHVVPLFRYRDQFDNVIHCMPHWIDVSFWKSLSSDRASNMTWVPRCRIYEIQMMGIMENELSAISIKHLPQVPESEMVKFMDEYDVNATKIHREIDKNTLTSHRKRHQDLLRSGRNVKDDNPLWTTILNPSNPTLEEEMSAILHGNWKHIYPRKSLGRSIKWKSVISPASLPITTEVFPSPNEFYRDYSAQTYEITFSTSDSDVSPWEMRDFQTILRAMVACRIGMGFQIIVGPVVQDIETLNEILPNPDGIVQEIPRACEGVRVYLSTGSVMHRIAYKDSTTILVQTFARTNQNPDLEADLLYKPYVQTKYDTDYVQRNIRFSRRHLHEQSWKQFDLYLAGEESSSDPSRYYRSRFVLIPTELQTSRYMNLQVRPFDRTIDNMSPEEIRLDGLRKLNEMFYRAQYLSVDERRRESVRHSRGVKLPITVPELKFYTSDLSSFIAQLIQTAGEDENLRKRESILMKASERFDRKIKLSVLAQEMQSERGIKFVDRRWHWKLHQHCFVGSEYVVWLLENFKDIDTSEAAVEYGNELMQAGLFHHVEHRHTFLEGHYFYQLNPEYYFEQGNPIPQRSRWFSSIRGGSAATTELSLTQVVAPGAAPSGGNTQSTVTSTPDITTGSVPTLPSRSVSVSSTISEESGSETLADSTMSLDSDWGRRSQQFGGVPSHLKPHVELSKLLKIDVDPTHKSYREEVITLHYDRLHNPESCYHIMLEWLNTTPKFIEDTIAQWSRTCDRSGFKLVEVPVSEAISLPTIDPFVSVTRLKFAIDPPLLHGISEASDLILSDKLFYQKQALLRLDYVLDTDAAEALIGGTPDVEIVYSWGKPHFTYSQYVHKTGAMLAELVPETGEIVLVRNPLAGNKSGMSPSTALSVEPNDVRQEAIDFFNDKTTPGLRDFFRSTRDRFLNRPAVAVPFLSDSPTLNEAYFAPGSASSAHTIRPGTSPVMPLITSEEVVRSLSTSPSARNRPPPPPPPSDTPGAAKYIYYDLRGF